MGNYYPKWVYDIREDITRENMKRYDRQRDICYAKQLEMEKELGRKLTIKERSDLYREYGI